MCISFHPIQRYLSFLNKTLSKFPEIRNHYTHTHYTLAMVNEIHSTSLLKSAAIMLPQQFLEMLDRLRLESMQHPQQSMGKSKLFPGAAIAMLHYPQSAPCPSIPCAPFPKRWRSQSEREWAGRAR